MFGLPWLTVSLVCVYGCFLFYVQKHATTFQGANAAYGNVLNLVAFLGLVNQLALYGAIWYKAGFLALAAVFALGIIAMIAASAAELMLKVPVYVLSMLGLIVVPGLGAWIWWRLFA